jgi:hypothetical protein
MATKGKAGRRGAAGRFPLAAEVETFEAHLSDWADRPGQFVLIRGRDVLGFFPRYEEALEAGYERFGDGPFLVKEIQPDEPVRRLGHVVL